MGVVKVRFKNGADAPEIVLDETFEDETAAKDRLEYLASTYGTVPEAVAWVDGTKAPKSVSEPVEVPIPEHSSLKEYVPSAPPAPEVLAAKAEEEAKKAAAEELEHAKAVKENLDAHAAIAKADAKKK